MRIAVGTLLAVLALGVAPEAQATLRSQERDLLTAVNHVRAARGLRPLRVDPALTLREE